MDDVLREISGELEFGDEAIGVPLLASQINLVQVRLAREDLLDLACEDLVLDLFTVEELGAFGGIVDDLGNLITRERFITSREMMDLTLL